MMLRDLVDTEELWTFSGGQWAVSEGFKVAEQKDSFQFYQEDPSYHSVGYGLQGRQPRTGRLLWGSEEKRSGSEGRR